MTKTNYDSCLAPFEKEILALRRKRPPMSFPKIAEYLREKHQISVRRQTIEAFLKVRVKGYKLCKYAWDIKLDSEANTQPTPEAPPVIQTPIPKPPPPAAQPTPTTAATPATAKEEQPVKFSYKYDPEKSLTHMPPELVEARRKELEQEENERKVKR